VTEVKASDEARLGDLFIAFDAKSWPLTRLVDQVLVVCGWSFHANSKAVNLLLEHHHLLSVSEIILAVFDPDFVCSGL